MKIFLLVICLVFFQQNCDAFEATTTCNALNDIDGLDTHGYKSDGFGYFCNSNYKDLDGKTNLAYYVQGKSNTNAEKVYLVLNVYETSDKIYVHEELLKSSRILAIKITGKALSQEIENAISNAVPVDIIQGIYKLSVAKKNWPTGLGYEIHFLIEELK